MGAKGVLLGTNGLPVAANATQQTHKETIGCQRNILYWRRPQTMVGDHWGITGRITGGSLGDHWGIAGGSLGDPLGDHW